jgi:alpha-1,2-mannosyltransferase
VSVRRKLLCERVQAVIELIMKARFHSLKSESGLLRLLSWLGIAFGLVILALEQVSLKGYRGSDFYFFYNAVQRALGNPATLYNDVDGVAGTAESLQGFLYPPPSIAMLLPFGLGSPETGFALLSWGALLAAIVALWLWLGALRDAGIAAPDRAARIMLMLLALASGPVFTCRAGQVDTLILLIIVTGTVLAFRNRAVAGAALLAFGAWVKIYPALLMLPIVVDRKRRWPAILGFGAGVVIVPAFAALVFPPSVWWTYFTEMMPVMAGRTIVNIDNQSLIADIVRLTLPHKQALTTYDTVAVSSLLRNGVALAGLVIIAAAQWRVWRTGAPQLVVAGVAMAVISLIAPLGWSHSYAYALPLLVMVAAQAMERRAFGWLAGIGLAYLAILFPGHSQFGVAEASPVLWHLIYSRYALATCLLLAAAWRFARR